MDVDVGSTTEGCHGMPVSGIKEVRHAWKNDGVKPFLPPGCALLHSHIFLAKSLLLDIDKQIPKFIGICKGPGIVALS